MLGGYWLEFTKMINTPSGVFPITIDHASIVIDIIIVVLPSPFVQFSQNRSGATVSWPLAWPLQNIVFVALVPLCSWFGFKLWVIVHLEDMWCKSINFLSLLCDLICEINQFLLPLNTARQCHPTVTFVSSPLFPLHLRWQTLEFYSNENTGHFFKT